MESRESTVLVLERDAVMRDLLTHSFRSQGYQVISADSEAAARCALSDRRCCLAVIDEGAAANAPNGGAAIRRQYDIPVLVLSSLADETDAVRALDLGADDYLRRPVSTRELVARARAVLRRATAPKTVIPAVVQVGRLALDPTRREVRLGERILRLTPIEYRLFSLLAQSGERVVPHDELLHLVWGEMHLGDYHMLHVNICRLRRKLVRLGDAGIAIRTEPGVGYSFATAPAPMALSMSWTRRHR